MTHVTPTVSSGQTLFRSPLQTEFQKAVYWKSQISNTVVPTLISLELQDQIFATTYKHIRKFALIYVESYLNSI